jgi:hypothetical protein
VTSEAFHIGMYEQKDVEVVQFFIDLLSIFIGHFDIETLKTQPTSVADQTTAFLGKTVAFLQFYFDTYFDSQFLVESTICCSLLNLICLLHTLFNNRHETSSGIGVVGKNFNENIIDKYLFTEQSICTFLDNNCKSIFVRKVYKSLMNQHLIYLIDCCCLNENKTNNDQEIRFNKLVFQTEIPINIRMHNFDINSDLVKHYLLEERSGNTLKSTGSIFIRINFTSFLFNIFFSKFK